MLSADKTEQDKRTEAALINEWMALLKARDEVVTHSVEAGSRSDSPRFVLFAFCFVLCTVHVGTEPVCSSLG